MVRQIRMRESYFEQGATDPSTRRVFGFGTHPEAIEVEEHPVTSASVLGQGPQGLRIIMDELLVGNNLEEISCRSNVDGDMYGKVPVGATPDDISRCSVAQDVLPSTCTGEHAVCICELDGGCTVGTTTIDKGQPVGVDDKNQDGAADDTRFIQGAVGIKCGNIDVPIDLNSSYWNPSGNQQPPAMGGFEALGPAIVLNPGTNGLPTNLDCAVYFGDAVVDKQGIRVCAPVDGDVNNDCTPGDTALAKFKTEPLRVIPGVTPNSTGVSRTSPIVLIANTNLDMSSTTGVTIAAGATPFTDFTVTITMGKVLNIAFGGTGLAANTTYTITATTGVKDTFMQGLPAPFTVTFTTGS